MNPMAAALGRAVLVFSVAISLPSYANAEQYRGHSELLEISCRTASSQCLAQANTARTDSARDQQQEYYGLVLAVLAVGGLGGWAAAGAMYFKRRSLSQQLQHKDKQLLESKKHQRDLAYAAQRLQEESDKKQKELSLLNQSTQEQSVATQRAVRQSSDLQAQVARLHQQNQQADARKSQLEAELASSHDKAREANHVIDQLRSDLRAAQQRVEGFTTEIQALHQNLSNEKAIGIQALKENDALIAEKDVLTAEKKELEQKILTLEIKIAALTSNLENLTQARAEICKNNAIILEATEADLYLDEKRDIIIEIIKSSPVLKDSRRQHVIHDILERNQSSEKRCEIEANLRANLRDYSSMDAQTKRAFVESGFEIYQEGKHYKAILNGDPRYTISFPKSGSDWRGGRNLIKEILNKCF